MGGAEAERELVILEPVRRSILPPGICSARGSPVFRYFTGSGDQGRKRMIGLLRVFNS